MQNSATKLHNCYNFIVIFSGILIIIILKFFLVLRAWPGLAEIFSYYGRAGLGRAEHKIRRAGQKFSARRNSLIYIDIFNYLLVLNALYFLMSVQSEGSIVLAIRKYWRICELISLSNLFWYATINKFEIVNLYNLKSDY